MQQSVGGPGALNQNLVRSLTNDMMFAIKCVLVRLTYWLEVLQRANALRGTECMQ